jgi:hypothetical protein
MEKSNVMEAGVLWREVVSRVHDAEYRDVELSHMLADAGAMQLVRWPRQFDVIVTDNLFGDLLSDAAAMLTGSLGMLPSASLGAPMANGRPKALYEPVHGSAPDIAGQGKANPIAMILSFAMALRYSFDLGAEAARVERAVETVLADGSARPTSWVAGGRGGLDGGDGGRGAGGARRGRLSGAGPSERGGGARASAEAQAGTRPRASGDERRGEQRLGDRDGGHERRVPAELAGQDEGRGRRRQGLNSTAVAAAGPLSPSARHASAVRSGRTPNRTAEAARIGRA